MAKVAIQGGGPNYLGKQPEVKVPRYWKSSPDHPDTELAYITEPEKKVLIALNMHGGLEDGKPNKGPKGIMSLQGDMGSVTSDGKGGNVGTGGDVEMPPAVAAAIAAGKPTSVDTKEDKKRAKKEAKDFRQSKYDKGYEPVNIFEKAQFYNTDFQKKQNIKLAQKRAFQKYQDIEQYADLMDDYGLTAEELAAEVAANPSYGYDFSSLDPGKSKLGSNIGTSLEKYRTNLYDVSPKAKYSVTQAILDKLRPDTQVTALNTLNKARDYNTLAMDPNISRDKLEALANRGKTPDQINPSRDREGPQSYLPFDYNTGAATTEVVEPYTNDFTYRFGDNQDVIYENYGTPGYRTTAAEGGIMNAVPRQGYFLGGIGKAVGKVVGGVAEAAGKVLSSDLGKAAIIGAGIYYGGGGGNPFTKSGRDAFSFFGNKSGGGFFSKSNPLLFSANKAGEQVFNPMKFAGLTTLGGFLAGPAKVDQMPGEDGGRGGRLIDPLTGKPNDMAGMRENIELAKLEADGDPVKLDALNQAYNNMLFTTKPYENYGIYAAANGGRIGKAEGGLMNLGGMEKDYRAEGGFVPIGKQEKADDVPARLSVNEFVFTADAVRNAGGGDIDKGAEVMENMMKNLENGGRVSEESQGNTGAQEMFSVSERIGEVI